MNSYMASETIKGSSGHVAAEAAGLSNYADGSAAEKAGDLYAKGMDVARDTIDELPATLSDASVAGERLIHQSRRRIDRGVRKQPVEALLLAGALGYLAGWAVGRG